MNTVFRILHLQSYYDHKKNYKVAKVNKYYLSEFVNQNTLPYYESIDFWHIIGIKDNFVKTINVSNILQSTFF